jgi:DnaJ-class molecular chaperone
MVPEDRDQLVHVERGMENGDHIVFQGAADEVPGADTGDLIVVIREQPHPEFRRKHSDLLCMKQLSLSEALFGARFVVQHLDGRKVVITTNPKEVITPGTVHMILGEGMPTKSDPFQRGRLFVLYSVAFPEHKTLTKEFRRAMCKIVPHVDAAKSVNLQAEDVVCVTAKQADVGAFEAEDVAHDEEEEEDNGETQGVPCASM